MQFFLNKGIKHLLIQVPWDISEDISLALRHCFLLWLFMCCCFDCFWLLLVGQNHFRLHLSMDHTAIEVLTSLVRNITGVKRIPKVQFACLYNNLKNHFNESCWTRRVKPLFVCARFTPGPEVGVCCRSCQHRLFRPQTSPGLRSLSAAD